MSDDGEIIKTARTSGINVDPSCPKWHVGSWLKGFQEYILLSISELWIIIANKCRIEGRQNVWDTENIF